ncbi:aspartate--tRNA(Asn) ligase [Bradyrhizobium yuanmingense]|uniref:aspartate--tRNA(Asn) ligase n=1 Tax=Bradyrhizobium yuanmingense TaxID=108015 RepID=UPI0023B9B6E3|nr:aspartate--tRNA(Asn) ligase [Bradyrhizobium yuanmingense]MDF0522696.1 aspartate--tRNA(Asn) ligase [Bradyrhizobium yuanmingense]
MSVPRVKSRTPYVEAPHPLEIAGCRALVGETVTLHGFLADIRRYPKVTFLSLRDHTGAIQIVCKRHDLLEEVRSLTRNSAIRVNGIIKAGRGEEIELEALGIAVLNVAEPCALREASARSPAMRFLTMREPREQLICAVRTTLLNLLRGTLLEQGYREIQTPKITAAGCESGAAVFNLSFFGEPACLVQSPQFYMQMAMAAGFGRVFEIGPVFRAEPSKTNRHAAEFSCLDVELSWISSHHDLMEVEESLLCRLLEELARLHGQDIERQFEIPVGRIDAPIPRISFEEALSIARNGSLALRTDRLSPQDEQIICKKLSQRTGSDFVFITDYPADDRPFYTMRDDGSSKASRSFDLLWRGVEITSGCQREHRFSNLATQIEAAGIDEETRARYLAPFYLTMFRHGCPPHGGFGLGIDRFLFMLLGCSSIADVSFVFRGPEGLMP